MVIKKGSILSFSTNFFNQIHSMSHASEVNFMVHIKRYTTTHAPRRTVAPVMNFKNKSINIEKLNVINSKAKA
jgi:hypothetical protein